MNRKFSLNSTALALGLALAGSTAMMQAYALTTPAEGYVEMGANEDETGDGLDIYDTKREVWDLRANIWGVTGTPPDTCNNEHQGGSTSEGCGYGPDWSDLFEEVSGVVGYKNVYMGTTHLDYIDYGGLTAAFVADGVVTYQGDDTVFAGGNKNDQPISSYKWKSGSVPPKDDVSNAYFYAVVGTSVSAAHDGHLLITGGFERISDDGDSHIDIEFNQTKIGLSTDGGTTAWYPSDGTAPPVCGQGDNCVFVGDRQDGDILVSMDFSRGGDFGTLVIHRWDGSQWQTAIETAGEGCNPANGVPAGSVCAYNNNGDIDPGPWMTFDRHGLPLASGGTLPRNAFTEGAMDINALLGLAGGESPPCISTVTVKTRSSTSFTATLKDFVLGSFEICGSVKVVKQATGLDGAYTFNYSSALETDDGLFDIPVTVSGGSGSNYVEFTDVVPGNYTITETDASGFGSFLNASCVYNAGGAVPGTYSPNSAQFDVGIGGGITCTFRNTQPTLAVTKTVNSCATESATFGLNIDTVLKKTVSYPYTDNSTGAGYVTEGAHTVSESITDGTASGSSTNTAWVSVIGGDCDASGNVSLAVPDGKTCTITNTAKPRVIVNKAVCNGTTCSTAPADISGFTLKVNGNTVTAGAVTHIAPDGEGDFPVVVGEEGASGYYTTIMCNNGPSQMYSKETSAMTLNIGDLLPGDEVTCDIVNVRQTSFDLCD